MQRAFQIVRNKIIDPNLSPAYQSNISRLYWDIFWWGILSGSTVSFMNVYATRIGATTDQIGWIGAVPAIVSLIFVLPFGYVLGKVKIDKAVFWSALSTRIFYVSLVVIPVLLNKPLQVNLIILMVLVMGIPGAGIAVGFTTLFGTAVPAEYRGQVAGIRNAIFAISSIIALLVSGQLLEHLPFPMGYQIVFAIGFIGSMMSTYQMWFVKSLAGIETVIQDVLPEPKELGKGKPRSFNLKAILQPMVLNGPYKIVLILLFFLHFAQYAPMPVFPVYQVKILNLSDQVISWGSSIFNVMIFIGSLQLSRLTKKFGNRWITGYGMVGLSLYPFFLALSHSTPLFLFTSLLGGAGWSLLGGALPNYLLDRSTVDNRAAHMAWYNMALNAAILLGSLVGPQVSNLVGLQIALFIFAGFRFLSGLAILRWG